VKKHWRSNQKLVKLNVSLFVSEVMPHNPLQILPSLLFDMTNHDKKVSNFFSFIILRLSLVSW